MLTGSSRPPDRFLIEHVQNIVERQLQHHTKPALTVPVLNHNKYKTLGAPYHEVTLTSVWHNACMLADLHSIVWRLQRLLM
ncbi:hypothetical protein TNCV_2369731 [Trichonephila clavipes]|nr:hypothetical protein TNCV_2369731 [Trichonephila clavipes]